MMLLFVRLHFICCFFYERVVRGDAEGERT
jgi:hypothetical protein